MLGERLAADIEKFLGLVQPVERLGCPEEQLGIEDECVVNEVPRKPNETLEVVGGTFLASLAAFMSRAPAYGELGLSLELAMVEVKKSVRYVCSSLKLE